MPDESHIRNRATARRPSQLDGIRARVARLCQRIKESRDPAAIREVQQELARVGRVLQKQGQEDGRG